jgi:hypothetical protein
MLLRLKGEPHDEDILAEDERDLDVDDGADQSPSESVFAEDDEELAWPLRGLAIATAAFVPTFVAIVFGLPYLFAPADAPRAAAVLKPPPVANRASEAPVAPPLSPSDSMKAPVAPAPTPSESMKAPVAPPQEEARAAVESTLPAQPPALPPIKEQRPQVAEPPRLPAPAPEPSLPSRQAPKPRITASEPPVPTTPPPSSKEQRAPVMKEPVVTKETPPVREAVAKDTTGWTPAAAFADRAAAQRLASGIEQQGYPVEIRQDGSSTRPWVVWIGAQPRSNGGGQRRH